MVSVEKTACHTRVYDTVHVAENEVKGPNIASWTRDILMKTC